MELIDELVETWRINNQVNLYLLGQISDEALEAQMQGYGRCVIAIFTHMHNVRIQWLQAILPDANYSKIPSRSPKDKANITREILVNAFNYSGEALATVFANGFESGKIRNVKPHPAAFLGYIIAHDTHHRGEIGIVLAQTGHKLPNAVDHELWNWQQHAKDINRL